MKILEENIGNTTIAIQAMSDSLEIIGEEGRATQLTGLADNMEKAYAQVKTLIKEVASDIGAELRDIQTSTRPQKVEMEFQVGLSAQIGPILVYGKSDYLMKIKITWELKQQQ